MWKAAVELAETIGTTTTTSTINNSAIAIDTSATAVKTIIKEDEQKAAPIFYKSIRARKSALCALTVTKSNLCQKKKCLFKFMHALYSSIEIMAHADFSDWLESKIVFNILSARICRRSTRHTHTHIHGWWRQSVRMRECVCVDVRFSLNPCKINWHSLNRTWYIKWWYTHYFYDMPNMLV